MIKNTLSFIIICLSFNMYAAMIIPYDDLGQLSFYSDDIVIAEVTEDTFTPSEEIQTYSWNLKIKKSFKGNFQADDNLIINAKGGRSHDIIHHVISDVKLEVGKTYLLFLDKSENGVWLPITSSYYVYSLENLNTKEFWVPTLEAVNACLWKDSNPIAVLDRKKMDNHLDQLISSDFTFYWDDNNVESSLQLADFHPSLRTPPSHCLFLGAGTCNGNSYEGVRWQAFPDNPVEVWLDTEQQTGIDSELITEDAIDELSSQYEGIFTPFEGIHPTNYNPTCANNNAVEGNFTNFSAGINGGDNIFTIFDDPCGQIADLNGCAGTLAIGGLYSFCTTNDNHDGLNWFEGIYGYIIVNNGSDCVGAADFEILMLHEYTHALGLGHIPSSNGTANMNPSCCNSITSLDIDCADYLYPLTVVPVEWYSMSVSETSTHNLIKWSTASEINNDHFVIEYSKESQGMRIWQELGIVGAAENLGGINEYQFEDYLNLGSRTTFYRIKQVDLDGTSSYSDIVSVHRNILRNEISLYPNPAKDLINILGDVSNSEVYIIDGLGRTKEIIKTMSNSHLTKLDISHLETGVYYIQIANNRDKSVHTFIKQ